MSVKDRIAAKKAAKDTAAPEDASTKEAGPVASMPTARSDRARRFSSAGIVDPVDPEPEAPAQARSASAPDPLPVPVPVPACAPAVPTPVPAAVQLVSNAAQPPEQTDKPPVPAASSRAARFAMARAPRFARDGAAEDTAGRPPPLEADSESSVPQRSPSQWSDPERPAGSAYSAEEWRAVEDAHPGQTVFEVLKAMDRSLITKTPDANDVVLHRSLIVHEKARCEWLDHATALMEHHGEFGVQRYRIIRSQVEREKAPWADGSKLVIKDEAAMQNHKPHDEPRSAAAPSRRDRFRG